MTLKLGVFTVMLPELTPEEAAKALQESGYTGVEWRMTTPSEKRNDPPLGQQPLHLDAHGRRCSAGKSVSRSSSSGYS